MKNFLFLGLLCGCLSAWCLDLVAPAGRMTIDGRLDEEAWKKAPRNGGFSMLQSRWPGRPRPPQDTFFRLLADEESLYIGVHCSEPDMASLKAAHHAPSGASIWLDDLVEIYFAPTGQPDEYYQFVISAGNGSWQMYYAEKGAVRPDFYAPLYEHQVFRGRDFYSIEIRIPLTALYMTSTRFMKREWLFNVCRQKTPALWSSWARLQDGFNELDRFHRVGGFPLRKREDNLQIREITARMNAPDQGEMLLNVIAEKAAAGEYALVLESDGWEKIPPRKVRLRAGENSLKIPSVRFLKTGKIRLRVRLMDDSGRIAGGRNYAMTAEFAPFAVEMTSPSYKNTFFPGQKADRLTGKIHLTAEFSSIRITAGRHSALLKPGRDGAAFDLPLEIKEGARLPVQFLFTDADGRTSSRSLEIRRLPPSGHRMVWVEPPGRIVRDGRRIFALGWYGNNSWKVSRPLVERFPKCSDKHPLNFTANVNLEPERLISGTEAREAVRDVKPCPEIFAAVRKRVEDSRNRDFDYYYLCDEPECRGVSPVYLKYLYDYVSELDPAHPVMIISRSPGRYAWCADILNPHPYLNPIVGRDGKRLLKSEVEVIRRRCQEISAAGRRNLVIMLCPQAFSYCINNNQAEYPTFAETSASIWSAVCHDAQGITPYIWYAHMDRPELYHGMDFIYTSLDRLAPWLVTSRPPVPVRSGNPQIDARCLEKDGEYLLILANVSASEQTAELQSAAVLPDLRWQVFREGRGLALSPGKKLVLKPYQVLLLSTVKLDGGLLPLSEYLARISRDEKARSSRKNILFGHGREIEISHSHCDYQYFSVMEQQELMFDGNCVSLAWLPHRYKELWYEMMFPKFVPKFSRVRVHGNGLQGMKFKIWKYGEWLEVPARIESGRFVREFDFGKTLSTVKIRLEFAMPKPGTENRLELYEFELLK